MSTRQLVPNRRYTAEFKIEAARLAESVGCNEASRRLEVPAANIGKWRQLLRTGSLILDSTKGPALVPGDRELIDENDRLRRELANVKLDLDILKKAAAYFARQQR